MKLFLPRYYVAGYDHVSVDRLKENGIRLLLCDIDNTLVSAFEPDPNEKVIRFIRQIEAAGIKVAVCSNSTRKRTLRFSEDLGIQKAYYLILQVFELYLFFLQKTLYVHPILF